MPLVLECLGGILLPGAGFDPTHKIVNPLAHAPDNLATKFCDPFFRVLLSLGEITRKAKSDALQLAARRRKLRVDEV